MQLMDQKCGIWLLIKKGQVDEKKRFSMPIVARSAFPYNFVDVFLLSVEEFGIFYEKKR